VKNYSRSLDRPRDIRSRRLDAQVAAKLQSLGVAYTHQAPITYINEHGDTAIHTASFKITASGLYIDVFNRLYGPADPLPVDTSAVWTPRYDRGIDVGGLYNGGPDMIRETNLMDTLRRIWFQNDAGTIVAPINLIFVNQFYRVTSEAGPRVTHKTWADGQTPAHADGYDPVFTWSSRLEESWLV